MPTKEELYGEAMDLFAEDKYADSEIKLRQAVEADPDYFEALHALSMVYYHQNKLDETIEVGKRLVGIEPENILAYTTLSMAYQKKGMIPEAEDAGGKAKALGFKDMLNKAKAENKKQ
ncbi:MAG: hypothetical protein ACR2L2_05735 [Acidobacteriota bacterium]